MGDGALIRGRVLILCLLAARGSDRQSSPRDCEPGVMELNGMSSKVGRQALGVRRGIS